MIGICPKCGSTEWNKEVNEDEITCPDCGYQWKFKKKPVFILTGCSGVGKTTTAMELQKITYRFVVLDGDFIHNMLWPQSQDDYYNMVEQILSLTKNINQSDKMVIWSCAGNLEKFPRVYSARFVSEIKILALTADSEEIRKRMTEGRGIGDEEWIQSSIDYNEYLKNHDHLEESKFETLDCTGETPSQVAKKFWTGLRTWL